MNLSVEGADAVISFVMRSKACWNMFVLGNTSFGEQFAAEAKRCTLCRSGKVCRDSHWLITWLEQHFRVTEAFDSNSGAAFQIAVGSHCHSARHLKERHGVQLSEVANVTHHVALEGSVVELLPCRWNPA